jgi:glycosyltransferase involved in cell wall biosynthesis
VDPLPEEAFEAGTSLPVRTDSWDNLRRAGMFRWFSGRPRTNDADKRKGALLPASLTFLWIVDFDYPTRLHHGGVIRFLNYSRELLKRGHRVYLATHFDPAYREASLIWFASLKDQGITTEFFELSYSPPRRKSWLAARVMHPGLGNWILRKSQNIAIQSVRELIKNLSVDVVIVSSRRLLFLVAALSSYRPCLIDFCDCASLYLAREIQHFFATKSYKQVFVTLPYFLYVVGEDRYYARKSKANLVVSPVDQRALSRVAGSSSKVYTILNGVTLPADSGIVEKVPNRLIFSGNMNFPPNCTAALWFLDNVFPLVLEQIPDSHLVLAGANPPTVLTQRTTHNVVITGYVEDLNHEIARSALYLAPLITGSGFKNKVVEAAANHTYLVATSVAVEFLGEYTRSLIAVADSPRDMADVIIRLLRDPAACESKLAKLYDHIRSNFTWSKRTDELLEIVDASLSGREQNSRARN